MNKIKQYWDVIYAAVALIVTAIFFAWSQKNKKIKELEQQLALTKTQKEADLVEVKIKTLLDQQNVVKKEQERLKTLLNDLDAQRNKIQENTQQLKNPKEIAEYWENN